MFTNLFTHRPQKRVTFQWFEPKMPFHFRGWKGKPSRNSRKISALCNTFTKLNKKQNILCMKYPDLMEPITRGVKTGVHECGRQMRNNRWNCSNVPEHGTLFGPVLPVGEFRTRLVL